MPCPAPPFGFKDWSSFLLVALVVFLITFIPVTSNIYVFYPWLSYYSNAAFWRLTWPFHLSVALLWLHYWTAMWVGPGTVPKGYDPWQGRVVDHKKDNKGGKGSETDSEHSNGAGVANGATRRKTKLSAQISEPASTEALTMVLELKKSTSEPRYCKTCKAYKPPRSHHCSDCNICVLRMDHHCPWVNTCVGQNNLGHFYKFLLTTSFASLYCVSLYGLRIWGLMQLSNALDRYYRTPWPHTEAQEDLAKYVTPQPTTIELVMMITNIILCFVLLFTVFILFLFQSYYVATNITTIETYEKERMDKLVERGKLDAERAKFPYDLGLFRNLRQILGPNPLLWLFPQKPEGDGIAFEVNETAKKHGRVVEKDGKRYVVVMYPPPEYFDFYGKKKRPVVEEEEIEQDEEPEPEADQDDVPLAPAPTQPRGQGHSEAPVSGHVRRGSEGYVVRSLTDAERERMIREYEAENGRTR